MPTVTITCGVPLSVNRTRGEHWANVNKRKRRLQAEIQMLLLAAGVPRPLPGDRAHATATIVHPINRRRDEGNFRAPLEKAAADALAPHRADEPHRWLSDDTPEHFTFGAITFATDAGRPARCELTITWGDELEVIAA